MGSAVLESRSAGAKVKTAVRVNGFLPMAGSAINPLHSRRDAVTRLHPGSSRYAVSNNFISVSNAAGGCFAVSRL